METLRMKSVMTSFVAILALGVAATASAQTKPAHDHPPQASASQPQLDVPAAAQAAVTVAERFGTALSSGDLDTVKALLAPRSEEHTSELQSLMRISYAVFCLK